MSDALRQACASLREALSAPIASVDELQQLLAPPLRFLGLLRSDSFPEFEDAAWSGLPVTRQPAFVAKHLPAIQTILIERIYVDWHEALGAEGLLADLFEVWFCPTQRSSISTLVHLSSLSVLLKTLRNQPMHTLVLQQSLAFLAEPLSLKDVHSALSSDSSATSRDLAWTDALKVVFAVSAKAANAASSGQAASGGIPQALAWNTYMATLASSILDLLDTGDVPAAHLAEAMGKFIATGFCSTSPEHSFWSATAPALWPKCVAGDTSALRLSQAFQEMLRPLNTQQLITSAVSFVSFISARHLRGLAPDPWSSSEASHDTLQAVAQLCSFLFGSLAVAGDGSIAWSVVKKVMLYREGWSPVWGRVVIAWVSISDSEEGALPPCLHVLGSDAVAALLQLLHLIVEVWADTDSIALASLQHRQCTFHANHRCPADIRQWSLSHCYRALCDCPSRTRSSSSCRAAHLFCAACSSTFPHFGALSVSWAC
jgi:hypothetical protein